MSDEIKRPLFEFYGSINKIITKADGGIRIELDANADSLIAVQMLQRMQVHNEVHFAFAMVPWWPNEPKPEVQYLLMNDNPPPPIEAWPPPTSEP